MSNMKKWFSVKLPETPEEFVPDSKETIKRGFLVKVEGECKEIEYSTYRIYLTDEEFPIILAGNKFLQIEESTDNINYYPSTNPQILKLLL